MVFVEADDGVRLHVQDLGEGPPVVFVAGFGLDHTVWDREVRLLTDRGHRVICVDQRGHGWSDKPLHGYDIDRLARDLVTVLENLGVGEATAVGWSFGGQTAFKAAILAPERITHLVLVASNAVRASRSAEFPFGRTPESLLAPLVAGEQAHRLRSRREGIAAAFATTPDPKLLDWLTGCSMRMPSWAGIACYHSMLESDQVADIDQLRAPVLQIIGKADPVFSVRGARWLNERLANAVLVELEECGHYPMFEQPDRFQEALLTFIDKHSTK